jgi:HlyD family secretion protein
MVITCQGLNEIFKGVIMKFFLLCFILSFYWGCSGNNNGTISASGTIEGINVSIGTEVAGKVKIIKVGEGTRVVKDDTLLIIDDAEYQIQLSQAQANLGSFESAYKLMVEGSRQEDVVQAEAFFKNAESDYNRMKELLAAQTITQKQYDDAYAKYISAQQIYQKLVHGSRKEEIEGARQKREYATAQVEFLKKKIRDCYITAPLNGAITLKAVEQGELVTLGSTVFRLTYLDKVKLTIYTSETEIGKIKLGQSAKVTIDADQSKTFDGTVIYISPIAEFTPKNVQTKEERTKLVFGVKIEVNNTDGILKPGLPADAMISVEQK